MVMRVYWCGLTRAPFFFSPTGILEARERKVGEREKLAAAAAQEIKAVPFTDTEVFPLFDLSQDRHGALYNIYIPGSLFN